MCDRRSLTTMSDEPWQAASWWTQAEKYQTLYPNTTSKRKPAAMYQKQGLSGSQVFASYSKGKGGRRSAVSGRCKEFVARGNILRDSFPIPDRLDRHSPYKPPGPVRARFSWHCRPPEPEIPLQPVPSSRNYAAEVTRAFKA